MPKHLKESNCILYELSKRAEDKVARVVSPDKLYLRDKELIIDSVLSEFNVINDEDSASTLLVALPPTIFALYGVLLLRMLQTTKKVVPVFSSVGEN